MAIIDKIKLSGQTFEIQDSNASKTVELTQAEYDALATKDPNTYYIITDATPIDITNYYTKTQTDDLLDDKLDVTAYTPTDLSNYYTKSETSGATQIQTALNGKADSSTVNSLNNVVTAHTASTAIHVTAQDKTNWNNKSDFSGDYNDLDNKPTIPTVPTSNTAFTNDAGYITSSALDGYATTGDVQTATADMATKTWVGNQGYLTEHQSLSNYYTKSETSGATQISTALASKQTTLTAGTNITIVDNVISAEGGGKAIEAGRGISITTGETADTINCTLPISADTRRRGTNLIFFDNQNTINHNNTTGNFIVGYNNTFGNYYEQAQNNFVFGNTNTLEGYASGNRCLNNFVVGNGNFFGNVSTKYAVSNTAVFGQYNKPKNNYEFVFGQYNNSVSASTTFGDSGNTLFSVGNGTADNARHNAFEIRQNGDIYLSLNGQDVKLQDQLGGGGSSYTAGDGIDITNDVISVTGKVDTSAITTSVTSSSTDAQVPSAKAVNDKLGGLSLVKLTQAEYDALVTKDSNTLYVING